VNSKPIVVDFEHDEGYNCCPYDEWGRRPNNGCQHSFATRPSTTMKMYPRFHANLTIKYHLESSAFGEIVRQIARTGETHEYDPDGDFDALGSWLAARNNITGPFSYTIDYPEDRDYEPDVPWFDISTPDGPGTEDHPEPSDVEDFLSMSFNEPEALRNDG
jgi:hypothetical protein